MVGEKREEKRKRNLSVFSTNRENVGTQGKLYLIFHTVSTGMRASDQDKNSGESYKGNGCLAQD